MANADVDIEGLLAQLGEIGYEVSTCEEVDNNGTSWKISFKNSPAVATVYACGKNANSVVGGKACEEERTALKSILDGLKSRELQIDPLNKTIVDLVRSGREDFFYDFKEKRHKKDEDLLHDVLCLSNNLQNEDAYLIIGVKDDHTVVGVGEECNPNNIYDFFRKMKFAGGHAPDIEVKRLLYRHMELAVIVCKSSKHVPFYLEEKYHNVLQHRIYTRLGDTNTPKDRGAEYDEAEKLWRIHFAREHEQDS